MQISLVVEPVSICPHQACAADPAQCKSQSHHQYATHLADLAPYTNTRCPNWTKSAEKSLNLWQGQ